MDIFDRRRVDVLRLTSTSLVVPDQPAIFHIGGKGAAECLQGIFTNDVIKAPPESLTYGAFLTAKGAIVFDGWIAKRADGFVVVADPLARLPAAELLKKQLPPRLATTTDLTDGHGVHWLLGPLDDLAPPNGLSEWPRPGHLRAIGDHLVCRGPATAAFTMLMVGPRGASPLVHAAAGVLADLRVARVLAGFPTMGAEIEDRTLPPEVGFDRLGGVSYSKGCYVGQETVARVHFRGHPNWLLRGIRGDQFDGLSERLKDGKPVLRATTVIRLDDGLAFGLGMVRREVESGMELVEGGSPVTVLELPLGLEVTKQ